MRAGARLHANRLHNPNARLHVPLEACTMQDACVCYACTRLRSVYVRIHMRAQQLQAAFDAAGCGAHCIWLVCMTRGEDQVHVCGRWSAQSQCRMALPK